MLTRATEKLLDRESEGYNTVWESLPANPRKMLIAAAFERPLVQPYSGEIVSRYNLANPSSARNGLEYLITHDLIEHKDNTYYIPDRFIALWLRRRFAGSII